MGKNYKISDFGVTRHEGVLKNGLRVVFIEKPFAPIRASMKMRAGSNFDPADIPGLAHFTEHIIAQGSKEIFKEDYWGIIESVGGYRNASTSHTWMSVDCEVAIADHLDSMRKHFTHALNEIYCSPEILENQRDIIISEIERKKSKIDQTVRQYFRTVLSNGSAWHKNNLGTVESVSSIKTSDITKFFDTYCCVENMVLVIAGGCTWQEVQKTFEDISFHHGKQVPLSPDPVPLKPGDTDTLPIDTAETKIMFCFKGPVVNTRDFALLSFALNFAHHGLTSRFYKKIRTERGLAYSIELERINYFDLSYMGTSVGVPANRVEEALVALKECYQELIAEGISQKEIDSKIDTMWFSAMRWSERSQDWIENIAIRELYPEKNTLYGSFPDDFNYKRTFTSKEILEALQKYIKLDEEIVLLAGKPSK